MGNKSNATWSAYIEDASSLTKNAMLSYPKGGVIVLIGHQGTGKSQLVKALVAANPNGGLAVVSSKTIGLALEQVTDSNRTLTRPEFNFLLREQIKQAALQASSEMNWVVIDANNDHVTHRKNLVTALQQAKKPVIGVWLNPAAGLVQAVYPSLETTVPAVKFQRHNLMANPPTKSDGFTEVLVIQSK